MKTLSLREYKILISKVKDLREKYERKWYSLLW